MRISGPAARGASRFASACRLAKIAACSGARPSGEHAAYAGVVLPAPGVGTQITLREYLRALQFPSARLLAKIAATPPRCGVRTNDRTPRLGAMSL
jgi:hypothetical protein